MSRKPKGSTGGQKGLFEVAQDRAQRTSPDTPLAERMRPETLDEIIGQEHLLGPNGPLRQAVMLDQLPSMILWGPPGSGKTTIARVIAFHTQATFVPYSAVLGSVAELRTILEEARSRRAFHAKRTILFIDELHRFNKAQQDAFLPHVEDGSITLIGATTENPSFAINAALLSRCRVFTLRALEPENVRQLLRRALLDEERGLGARGLRVGEGVLERMAEHAQGDGRRALNALEQVDRACKARNCVDVSVELLSEVLGDSSLLYDKDGEEHYNLLSAFIKSMRGTDPDAAIYWMMRMLEAGEDPLVVLRRMIIFASEDIGNADPSALQVAVSADEAFRRLGMPEGIYPLSQAVLYLAVAPKSNSVKTAWQKARAAVRQAGALEVPLHLRNATTKLAGSLGYGRGYRYPHDEPEHFSAGQTYLPERLVGEVFYEPSGQGLEKRIGEKLRRLRKRSG